MNVSELARKLKINTKELLDILPGVGFDIGKRAIKVDDRTAQKIIRDWPRLLYQYKEKSAILKSQEEKNTTAEVKEIKTIAIPAFIRVRDLAIKLNLSLPKVISELMKNGVLSSMNEQIDFETAAIVSQELGFNVVLDHSNQAEDEAVAAEKIASLLDQEDKSKLKSRPPVVVVMGHVDHGKTKLLDAIRKTNVVDSESGGITQHIGAYQVEKKGRLITFIDTPGHEAFSTMRSRGAQIADIAILVIAADDGIQPQTKESIKIINSAKIPMIVAINKVDKPDANIDKVKQELAALDLNPEEWGGKTICVPVSAKAGTGIDELLEMILLVADTHAEDIMANPDRLAFGTIIESRIDKCEGNIATVLVQNGTLLLGDLITVSDMFYGKIRAMKNFKGENVKAAGPSMPVKILGLKGAPSIGDILQVKAEVDRKTKVNKYQLKEQATAYTKPMEKKEEGAPEVKNFNIVLKADVLGSLEAIINSLGKFEHPEVSVDIICRGLGNITESDIERAEAGKAVVFGFHVKPTAAAENLAREKKVEIRLYEVIYKLLEDVKVELEKLLSPEVIRTDFGRMKVAAVFYKEKKTMVVGGPVIKGKAIKNAKVDVLRDNQKIGTGLVVGLQSNKVETNEVEQGRECGLKYEGKLIIAVGDILEIYTEQVKQKKIS